MAGLSTDPEKRRRQLAGLGHSNRVVEQRLAEGHYEAPAQTAAQHATNPEPADPTAKTPEVLVPQTGSESGAQTPAASPRSAAPSPGPATNAPITHTAAGRPVVGYQEPPRAAREHRPEPSTVDHEPEREPEPVDGPPEHRDAGRDAGERSGGGFWSGFRDGI